jgi:formylglycine-generating enzyme required for sulfatase activity
MTEQKRPLKVFLCHAHDDKAQARELYSSLKKRGIQPWLDAEDLLPGQNWQVEIPKALETSDAIIILLSQTSVDKEGYVQKEIKFALDKALEMPEGRIFVIPARLDECEAPRSLKSYHWVNLFEEDGREKLMKSLKVRALELERATVKTPKPGESKTVSPARPEPGLSKNISVHVDGNVQGNIIIGNENAVQSLPAQLAQGKSVEANPEAAPEKSKPEKPIPPVPVAQKPLENEKPPRKVKPEYIVAIIGLIGTILAALIGILPQVFPALSVHQTPEPSPIPTKSFTPTATPLPTEIVDAKGVTMRLVPAGEFTMGSDTGTDHEKPAHVIDLDSFYMDIYEVTNELYKLCVEEGSCTKPLDTNNYVNPSYTKHPVVHVNWGQAIDFCAWRDSYLPTESQWEKAARGTDERSYPWGENINPSLANYAPNVGDTSPVGSYPDGISPYGIHDLAGNVSEWVNSWYDAYPGNSITNPDFGQKYRVLRGGSWGNEYFLVRALGRNWDYPVNAYSFVGFRCARDVNP